MRARARLVDESVLDDGVAVNLEQLVERLHFVHREVRHGGELLYVAVRHRGVGAGHPATRAIPHVPARVTRAHRAPRDACR